MRSLRLSIALILGLTHFLQSYEYVQPEPDGRSYFAVNMGNILDIHSKTHSNEKSYTISPAAVQKTLAIFYNSAEDGDDLLDLMLMEMGLKYFDAIRLMETAIAEMTTFEVLQEDRFEKLDKPIKRSDILNFFKPDFSELRGKVHYSTTITTPKNLQLSADFIEFAKGFFNTSILPEDEKGAMKIYDTIYKELSKIPNQSINVYNEISLKASWKPSFVETSDHLTTRGNFLYGEILNSEDRHISARIIELALECDIPLSVVLIMPKHERDLAWTTSYEVLRPITDQRRASSILTEHLVEVKLPKEFLFRTRTNLIECLRKIGLTRAKIYEAPQKFKRYFNNSPRNGVKLGDFWQDIELEVEANIVKELPEHQSGFLSTIKEKIIDLAFTESFDVTGKAFLYMVKSKDVIYFMGHYYGQLSSK